jgi:hypothetical protein
MVQKKEIKAAVRDLRKELTTAPRVKPPEHADSDENSPPEQPPTTKEESAPDRDLLLSNFERLMKEYGLEIDELKDLWDQFVNELKDLPADKPMATMFGAFLLGFLAGRLSRD